MFDRLLRVVQIAGVEDAEHQFHLLGVLVIAVVRQELLIGAGRLGRTVIAGQLVRDVQQGLARQHLLGVQPHQFQVQIGRRGDVSLGKPAADLMANLIDLRQPLLIRRRRDLPGVHAPAGPGPR